MSYSPWIYSHVSIYINVYVYIYSKNRSILLFGYDKAKLGCFTKPNYRNHPKL